MKFLVDAQLPVRVAGVLTGAGHDAVHTSQLPEGNRTTDALITELADAQGRVVVTKDRDFQVRVPPRIRHGPPGTVLHDRREGRGHQLPVTLTVPTTKINTPR